MYWFMSVTYRVISTRAWRGNDPCPAKVIMSLLGTAIEYAHTVCCFRWNQLSRPMLVYGVIGLNQVSRIKTCSLGQF